MKKSVFLIVFLICTLAYAQQWIPNLDIGNIGISGNTISTTDSDGDLLLSPEGTGAVQIPGLTASTVPYLDAGKRLQSSSVTSVELGYLSGVTSSIQTQLDSMLLSPGSGAADTVLTASGATSAWSLISNANVSGSAAIDYSKLDLANSVSLSSDITGTLPVGNGGTGQTTLTSHGVLLGNGASGIGATSAGAAGTLLAGQGASSDPSFSSTPTLGIAGTTSGSLTLANSGGAAVTVQNNATTDITGSYNFNLPVTAGTTGYFLTSAGGGSSPMTWTSVVPIANGGTNNGSLGVTAGGVLYTDGSKVVNIGAGSSGQVLKSNGSSAPAWGATGAGGTNEQREYISNGKAETDTTGWATYADAAAATPADGTGGSPNVLFLTTSAAGEVIRETASFKLEKDAADRQGEGVSYDFTIDPHDYKNGRPVYVSFDYKTTTNYASSDIICSVYDKDATTLLTLFDSAQLNGALPASPDGTRFTGRFYPTSTTSDEYRLICHIATTNASAYNFIFDSVHAGTSGLVPGFIGSGQTAYTPTITHASGGITNATTTASYTRLGDKIFVDGKIVFSSTSAAFSGLYISVPSQYPIDLTYLRDDTSGSNIGCGAWLDSGVAGGIVCAFTLGSANTTSVQIRYLNTASGSNPVSLNHSSISNTAPVTFNSSDAIDFHFSYRTNVAASASLSTTEALFSTVKVSAVKSSGNHTSTGNWQDVAWTEISDPFNVFDGTTFTAPKNGRYVFTGSLGFAANVTGARGVRWVNQASFTFIIGSHSAGSASIDQVTPISIGVDMIKGSTVKIQSYQNSGGNLNYSTDGTLTIEEAPGFSVFSVYGPFEIKTATSSTKTPSATAQYHALTNNSIALTAGTWKLKGTCQFRSPGSSAAFSTAGCGWYGANGADSGSTPADLNTVAVVLSTDITGVDALNYSRTGTAPDWSMNTFEPIVRCSSTCTVYLVSYAEMSTAANARATAYLTAERLQ